MTRLLLWTTNLYAPVNMYLSSDDLISSDTAHGPIPISGPFIPTVAIQIQNIYKKNTDGIVDDN